MPRMNQEQIKRMKRRDFARATFLALIIVIAFVFGASFGFYYGIQYSAREYVKVLALIFENSDIKMNINMTLNQTEMMDYMLDKMGINETVKKEYIPPCNMDPDIPRGETGVDRCIVPREVNFTVAR